MSSISNLVQRISSWIRQRVKSARARGVVVGLSGGVDSAVVAVLAKKALRQKVLALVLPCHSRVSDRRDAQVIARKFHIKARLIDLSPVYDIFIKYLPSAGKIIRANLKARLRMVTLYYFANKLDYLVAGTGNKSEITLGYFTKYGDGGVDILPIGGLLKKEVRLLARTLGIPEKIINKTPSAGLWLGQTDEGELGITYTQLDNILSNWDKPRLKQFPDEEVTRLRQMIKNSAHKRRPPDIFNPSR